jgi:predicted nucleotidyltransferase component of viral defense system
MALEHLRDDTKKLFDWFSRQKEARDFVLIGGTAMAIHVGHRQSEDLDLVYAHGRLPPRLIKKIITKAEADGFDIADGTDELSRQEAENVGRDIAYDHQDWFLDGVKFSFILKDASPSITAAIEPPHQTFENLSVANIESIFHSKAILLLSRQTSRDLFDIWYFIEHMGKTIADIAETMSTANRHSSTDLNLRFIKSAKLTVADPGFSSLLQGAPRDFAELKKYFLKKIDEYEQAVAAALLRTAKKF